MITDPDIDYTTTPANMMTLVEFMHKVGRLKHPASWKECSSPRRTTSRAADALFGRSILFRVCGGGDFRRGPFRENRELECFCSASS